MPGPTGTATAVVGFYNGTLVTPAATTVVNETTFLELYMEKLVNATFSTGT
jgi:hypothetical protein